MGTGLFSRGKPRAGAEDDFPFPVVTLAFSRTETLDALLSGLLSQHRRVRPQQIFVMQDGVINPWSKDKKISFREADAVHRTALKHLPPENVIRLDRNLGISLIWREVFRLAFERLDAEYAVLLEDDFLPGAYYMDALLRLHSLMREHPRIALANAIGYIYPNEPVGSSTVADQQHLWGALYSRAHWRRIEPQLADYYRLIEEVDDRERPHHLILEFFRSHGLGYASTSFDSVLAAMAAVNGFARVNTRKAFGDVQRAVGTTVTQAILDYLKVAEQGGLADIAALDATEADLDAIVAFQREFVKSDQVLTPQLLRSLSMPGRAWQRQIAGVEAIRWGFRIMLGRDPSIGEIQHYEQGRHSLAEFCELLMSSREFLAKLEK